MALAEDEAMASNSAAALSAVGRCLTPNSRRVYERPPRNPRARRPRRPSCLSLDAPRAFSVVLAQQYDAGLNPAR